MTACKENATKLCFIQGDSFQSPSHALTFRVLVVVINAASFLYRQLAVASYKLHKREKKAKSLSKQHTCYLLKNATNQC